MEDILTLVLRASLVIHIGLLAVCVWRVCLGENAVDRLIGADLVGMLVLAVLVLLAVIQRDTVYIDVALGLAALGFITSIALAKFFADQQMF